MKGLRQMAIEEPVAESPYAAGGQYDHNWRDDDGYGYGSYPQTKSVIKKKNDLEIKVHVDASEIESGDAYMCGSYDFMTTNSEVLEVVDAKLIKLLGKGYEERFEVDYEYIEDLDGIDMTVLINFKK